DLSCDEFASHLLVERKLMVRCQVMPVFRAVVHEVEAKGRSLPCYNCSDSHLSNQSFQPALNGSTQGFHMAVNFAAIHQQTFDRSDGGCCRDRVGIVGSGDEHSLRGVRMDRPIHPFLLPAQQSDGITIGDRLSVDCQVRLNSSDAGVPCQTMPEAGFHFIENEQEPETVC